MKAGIYFDEDNNLQVVDRQDRICRLEISPFRKHLNECVVYLDEFHTRGTDIRFPYGTREIITKKDSGGNDKTIIGIGNSNGYFGGFLPVVPR